MAQSKLPILVAHADWSKSPSKRWIARAVRRDGCYYAFAPEMVGDTATLLERLREMVDSNAAVLIGFDFPIGVPVAYARRVGVNCFLDLLPLLGMGEWRDFYNVAERPEEITLRRPFYPQRPGAANRNHLFQALGVSSFADILRQCERPQPDRKAACPLFWTLGGNQVGKGAIIGWREELAPALRSDALDVVLWPFAGALPDLIRPGRTVIAETYPTEFYGHLGLGVAGRGWTKRSQDDRASKADALLTWAHNAQVGLHPELRSAILDGFGSTADGEDRFDALIGLFGMLGVVLGQRPTGEPNEEHVRNVEGWILGQRAVPGWSPQGGKLG